MEIQGGGGGYSKKLVNSRSLSGLDPGTAHIALLHATPLDYLKRKLNSQRNSLELKLPYKLFYSFRSAGLPVIIS